MRGRPRLNTRWSGRLWRLPETLCRAPSRRRARMRRTARRPRSPRSPHRRDTDAFRPVPCHPRARLIRPGEARVGAIRRDRRRPRCCRRIRAMHWRFLIERPRTRSPRRRWLPTPRPPPPLTGYVARCPSSFTRGYRARRGPRYEPRCQRSRLRPGLGRSRRGRKRPTPRSRRPRSQSRRATRPSPTRRSCARRGGLCSPRAIASVPSRTAGLRPDTVPSSTTRFATSTRRFEPCSPATTVRVLLLLIRTTRTATTPSSTPRDC